MRENFTPEELEDLLAGAWTPQRVLYLVQADQVDAVCFVLNRLNQYHLEESGGPEADVAAFHRVVDLAVEELSDMALSNNMARRHHLESAVAGFAAVGQLLEAEKIVKDLLTVDDPPTS